MEINILFCVPAWFLFLDQNNIYAFQKCYNLVCSNYYRPQSEGDNAFGSFRLSIRLSISPFVSALTAEPLTYQSEVFVCVAVIRGHILIIACMRFIGILI